MTEKIKNVLIIVLLVFIAFGAVRIYQNMSNYEDTKTAIESESKELKKVKKTYEIHKEKVDEQVAEKAVNSDNQNLKSLGEYTVIDNSLTTISNKFFKVFFTWSDGKEYLNRKNELSKIITDELKNNKQIFDDGLDTTGENYIDNTGLKSSFINVDVFNTMTDGNKLVGVAKVDYKSWYENQRENSGSSTSYYQVNYDPMLNKIEKIYPLK